MNKHSIKNLLNQDGFWLMLHALLRDALTLSLLAFAGLMTIEGLIPGFVSGHLNLAKVIFVIALLFFAFTSIGRIKNIPLQSGIISKGLSISLLLWSSLLILNTLIKFPLYAILIIFVLTALIAKLVYTEFFTIG
jgi:hypothetical protein